ncbi:Zinc finger CCHC-type superfamily [Arabidopsis suecica]|uniref:Zinc finger CCHC-type superfamily n=1 Tax=Arabidopsis suecica TaxID=45249 RepID=A0A8T2BZC6_ARASU|nr:Zinc finger CCHC-type superfamily [Arabidopsis suecica]
MPKKKKKLSRQIPVRPTSKFDRVLASSSSSGHRVFSTTSKSPPSDMSNSGQCSSAPPVESKGVLPPTPGALSGTLESGSALNPPSFLIPVEAMCPLTSLPSSSEISTSAVTPVSESSSAGHNKIPPSCSPADGEMLPIKKPAASSFVQSYADVAKSSPEDRLWASKFKASLRNLKQMDPPTFMEDGTPVVVGPPSVLLKTAAMWKGHLVAQFHGLCHPTRQWVVDIGFWHAGNCSCTVYPWTPEGPLELEELQTAPTWAVLRNVPPQLYSLEGISVIASGIGEPLHTEKSWLDPINIGTTKVKVIIKLDSVLPTTVVVRDTQGNSARVAVEYPRPPPKCLNCGRFGHLLSRCPKPLMKKLPFRKLTPSGSKDVTYPAAVLPSGIGSGTGEGSVGPSEAASSKGKRRRSRSKRRASSLPPRSMVPQQVDKGKKVMDSPSVVGKKWAVKVSDHKVASPSNGPGTSEKGFVDSPSSHLVQVPPDCIAGHKPKTSTSSITIMAEVNPKLVVENALFPIPPGWGVMSKKSQENAASVLAATFPGWRMENNYCCSELGRICSPLCDTPWLLMGDFNQIASTSEHFSINPSSFSLSGLDDFQSCLRDNDLADLPCRGVFFTWSNHQQENPIIRKLDRAVGNGAWFNTFRSAVAVFDPPGDSDHSPCIISLMNHPDHSKKSFKYFSFLASHQSFLSCLSAAWEEETLCGSMMFVLGEKLKKAKKACRLLNRQGFGNLQQRTKEALTRLEDIQSQLLSTPSDSLFRQEHVARKKWKFFAIALKSFYRQKSRIKWLKEGDANTRFFHMAVIAHHSKNLIKYLRGEDDSKVENVQQIKDMIITYYTHLLGTESDSVMPLSIEDIKSIHPFCCDDTLAARLSAIPTDEEISQCVFSMPKNKAPGPDGFPAEFYWDSWQVVKDSVISAVREFFLTGHLLKKFNTTAITLIPKETGADRL